MGGYTWFGEKEIYHGPCWEPHLIELPSGEIQCFFLGESSVDQRQPLGNGHAAVD